MARSRLTTRVMWLAAGSLMVAGCANRAHAGGPRAQPTVDAKAAALVLSDIPGLDFSKLSAPAQRELATVFTDEFCYCGCPHTLGACLKQHGGCKHAKRMALLAAGEAASGAPATEVILELSRYYQSFSEKRASFKIDPRLCQGPKDAPATLVAFSAFDCPFCALARPMLDEFAKSRKDVRLCFAPFPLAGHANSTPAAQAALFARDQGKFWAMHDLLFENQMTLSPTEIKRLAASVGLDAAELGKAIDSGKYLSELNASKEAGKAAGVDRTPTVFINGRRLSMGLSEVVLGHTVNDELEWMANKSSWAAD